MPGVALLYFLPNFIAGYSHEIPSLLLARNVAATDLFSFTDALGRFLSTEGIRSMGVLSAADGRLSALLFAATSRQIAWDNLLGLAALSAFLTALAALPFWFAVRHVRGERTAWIATAVFAFLPLTWKQALVLDNYHFAVLFLLLSIAAFLSLYRRYPKSAVLVAGLLFGASLAAKDVFFIFVPWILFGYLWEHRERWKRGVGHLLIFLAASGCIYLLPYAGDIRMLGYPVNQNLARVWPGAEEIGNEIYLHLYPDPYTYTQDRERFERELIASLPSLPPVERIQKEKILLNFGLGRQSALRSVGNGFWLLLGDIPSFFHQGTVGGFLLWLFLIPGFLTIWKERRRLAVHAVVLIASSFFIISFVLHFSREHLMDVSWILAFFVAAGIVSVSDALAHRWKKISTAALSSFIAVVFSLHLLQVDRIETGRLFRKPMVPETLAVASVIRQFPSDAVIAVPGHANSAQQYALLSNRSIALFQPETLEYLLQKGTLEEAFATYGVTHAVLYPETLSRDMQRAIPGVTILPRERMPTVPAPAPGAALRLLLHWIQ